MSHTQPLLYWSVNTLVPDEWWVRFFCGQIVKFVIGYSVYQCVDTDSAVLSKQITRCEMSMKYTRTAYSGFVQLEE